MVLYGQCLFWLMSAHDIHDGPVFWTSPLIQFSCCTISSEAWNISSEAWNILQARLQSRGQIPAGRCAHSCAQPSFFAACLDVPTQVTPGLLTLPLIASKASASKAFYAHSLRCVRLSVTLWMAAHGICPRKNTGLGCHFLLQGDLSDPGIKPSSPISPAGQADFLPLSHRGSQSPLTWVPTLYRAMCLQLTEGSLWISSLNSEGQVHRPSLSLALLETLRLHHHPPCVGTFSAG